MSTRILGLLLVIILLQGCKNSEEQFLQAVSKGDTAQVEKMLAGGIDVKLHNKSALYVAALNNHTMIAKDLIAAGADVNYQGLYEETPLVGAITRENIEIVKMLLAAKAEVNPQIESASPLIWAATIGNVEIVKLLLDAKADVNLSKKSSDIAIGKNRFWGGSALNGAAYNGHTEVVKLLLAAGADISVTDKYDKTALMSAEQYHHQDIVELIKAIPVSSKPKVSERVLTK